LRSGAEYISALDDDRAVFIDGARAEEIADHPAFAGVARSVATLFDVACEDPEMHWTHPEYGVQANRVYMQPRSVEDLRSRRAAITRWAELSAGFLGRGPDHVGSFFAGFAAAPDVFGEYGANVQRVYRRILEEDLYVTYAIIPPQNLATRPGAPAGSKVTQVGVAEEREDGIVVRGAQMLATGAPLSDLLFVSCIKPLRPGEEDVALSFVVPPAAPGLKLYCRRPYAVGQPSAFDYPLSTRFDEPDAMVVMDDVLIPWEDVFVYRSIDGVRDQFHATPAHVLGNTQAQIRLMTKLKFLLGLAVSVCRANGLTALPAVQDKLGELASLTSLVESAVLASEANAAPDEFGLCKPAPRFLYGIMGLQSELYPRVLHVLRELSGAGIIGTPSSVRDLTEDDVRTGMEDYLADSPDDLEGRVKLFKLVWDAVGSEFAGRHHQYEMFYAGAPFVARGYAQRNYGFAEPVAMVERLLATYSIAEHEPPRPVGS
jgi:4-hydroxyphenylacetate 3-monooxygenase